MLMLMLMMKMTLYECEKGKRKRRVMGKEVGKSSFDPSAQRDVKP